MELLPFLSMITELTVERMVPCLVIYEDRHNPSKHRSTQLFACLSIGSSTFKCRACMQAFPYLKHQSFLQILPITWKTFFSHRCRFNATNKSNQNPKIESPNLMTLIIPCPLFEHCLKWTPHHPDAHLLMCYLFAFLVWVSLGYHQMKLLQN
jgi:hypothetical protein